MSSQQDATLAQVIAVLHRELPDCTEEQRQFFRDVSVRPYRAPIVRYGNLDHVYVVALRDGEALYWEDIEEGWNTSPVNEGGELAEHWCNQDELRVALRKWMPRP